MPTARTTKEASYALAGLGLSKMGNSVKVWDGVIVYNSVFHSYKHFHLFYTQTLTSAEQMKEDAHSNVTTQWGALNATVTEVTGSMRMGSHAMVNC